MTQSKIEILDPPPKDDPKRNVIVWVYEESNETWVRHLKTDSVEKAQGYIDALYS